MKRITQALITVILFSIISCSQQSRYKNSRLISIDDFPSTQALTGETVTFDSILMRPWQMALFDTVLVVKNLNTEKHFHLFNIETRKKIGERISMGQGPEDMIMPFIIPGNSGIRFFDAGSASVSEYHLQDFVNSPSPKLLKRIKLSENIMTGLVKLDDKLIGNPFQAEHMLLTFNLNGEKTGTAGGYPVSDITYTDLEKPYAYYSNLLSNNKDKFAVFYCWSDLFEIYDKDGKLEKRVHGPEYFYPHFKEFSDGNISFARSIPGESKDAYYSPVSTGDEIFVLFNGKDPHAEGYNLLATRIFVFDWNGNPRKILNLDKGVSNIAVDPTNKIIYGISEDPEYHILEFMYN